MSKSVAGLLLFIFTMSFAGAADIVGNYVGMATEGELTKIRFPLSSCEVGISESGEGFEVGMSHPLMSRIEYITLASGRRFGTSYRYQLQGSTDEFLLMKLGSAGIEAVGIQDLGWAGPTIAGCTNLKKM